MPILNAVYDICSHFLTLIKKQMPMGDLFKRILKESYFFVCSEKTSNNQNCWFWFI